MLVRFGGLFQTTALYLVRDSEPNKTTKPIDTTIHIISYLLDEVLVLRRAPGELPRGHAVRAVGGRLPLLVLCLVLEHLGVRQVVAHDRLHAGVFSTRRQGGDGDHIQVEKVVITAVRDSTENMRESTCVWNSEFDE